MNMSDVTTLQDLLDKTVKFLLENEKAFIKDFRVKGAEITGIDYFYISGTQVLVRFESNRMYLDKVIPSVEVFDWIKGKVK